MTHRVVTFPEDLLKRAEPTGRRPDRRGRTDAVREPRQARATHRRRQLGERIAGLQEEIAGLTTQAEAKSRELYLIGKELAGLETLEAQQLVPTSKMMALRREGARLEGEKAQLQAAAGSSTRQDRRNRTADASASTSKPRAKSSRNCARPRASWSSYSSGAPPQKTSCAASI